MKRNDGRCPTVKRRQGKPVCLFVGKTAGHPAHVSLAFLGENAIPKG